MWADFLANKIQIVPICRMFFLFSILVEPGRRKSTIYNMFRMLVYSETHTLSSVLKSFRWGLCVIHVLIRSYQAHHILPLSFNFRISVSVGTISSVTLVHLWRRDRAKFPQNHNQSILWQTMNWTRKTCSTHWRNGRELSAVTIIFSFNIIRTYICNELAAVLRKHSYVTPEQ